jgi:putative ABC transport system permease protein
MGRLLIVARLAARDLRYRRVEAALLLLAVLAATTTLTLGLVVRDAATDPYENTRTATNGPDVVAHAMGATALADLDALTSAPGVTDHSGPFPVTGAVLQASGRVSDVQIMGRDPAPAPVDQPEVVRGTWVGDGGVVVEAAFAAALDVEVGDGVTLGGRTFRVVGLAVSAAMAPYPKSTCVLPCFNGNPDSRDLPPELLRNPGTVWLARAEALSLAADGSLAHVLNLKLADPAAAPAFVETHPGDPWQSIRADATEVAGDAQILLLIGAWVLGLLAVASLSVLVGGRMAAQTRRVGLLKAVGGTPGLVAAVLLAQYVLLSLVAAAAGLTIGSLAAPLLAGRSAGLLGSAGTPSLTLSTAGVVTGVALAVAILATAAPALRAARSSTVEALADAARPPRRVGWLIAVSARLPVPLLLALRVAARRPRRAVLATAGIAITVSGVYVALVINAFLGTYPTGGGHDDSQVGLLRQVLLVWTVTLLCLTAVNAVVITWATVLDNRHASALARALGATPGDVSAAMATAQVIPALVGAVLGVFPGGYLLMVAVNAAAGGDSDRAPLPPLWQLAAVVLATVVVVATLTAVPARLGGRRPVAETLRAGTT